MIDIRTLGLDDIDLLLAVPPDLFDNDLLPDQARAFLADNNNILIVAVDGDLVVGMVTATVLLHPDKAPALFVNEVGTRDSHLQCGIATTLMQTLFDMARARGCEGIWLGTEPDNEPALGLYRKLGGKEVPFVGFGWDDAL